MGCFGLARSPLASTLGVTLDGLPGPTLLPIFNALDVDVADTPHVRTPRLAVRKCANDLGWETDEHNFVEWAERLNPPPQRSEVGQVQGGHARTGTTRINKRHLATAGTDAATALCSLNAKHHLAPGFRKKHLPRHANS